MEVHLVAITDLKEAEYNPREASQEEVLQLERSLREFGFVEPIVVNKYVGRENTIVGGHFRVRVAKQLGITEVPCVYVELDEAKERELNLRLNKNTGHWDMERLVQLEQPLLLDVGFTLKELDAVIHKDIQEDEAPEPPKEAKSKLGDLYQLGNHRLLCGDATKKEDVERLMDGQKADMVFTDPPYELETKGGGILKNAKQMKAIDDGGVGSFDPSILEQWADVSVFFHNKPLIKAYIELAERWGGHYDLAIYKKRGLPNYNSHLMTDIEYIAIIGNLDPNKGLPMEQYSKVFEGNKDTDNSLSYSKPVILCSKFIQLYSTDSVLDLFGGSGSTLIACEQLNRKCYIMEIDPRYVDVIIERWEKFTGKKAEKLA